MPNLRGQLQQTIELFPPTVQVAVLAKELTTLLTVHGPEAFESSDEATLSLTELERTLHEVNG